MPATPPPSAIDSRPASSRATAFAVSTRASSASLRTRSVVSWVRSATSLLIDGSRPASSVAIVRPRSIGLGGDIDAIGSSSCRAEKISKAHTSELRPSAAVVALHACKIAAPSKQLLHPGRPPPARTRGASSSAASERCTTRSASSTTCWRLAGARRLPDGAQDRGGPGISTALLIRARAARRLDCDGSGASAPASWRRPSSAGASTLTFRLGGP